MVIGDMIRCSQFFIVSSYSVGSVLDTPMFLDTPREKSNSFLVIYNGKVHCY